MTDEEIKLQNELQEIINFNNEFRWNSEIVTIKLKELEARIEALER